MKLITITIQLGNDAMQTKEDVANALRNTADKLEARGFCNVSKVMDVNGNAVGTVEYTESN
jgi:hypothetical protein